MEQAHKRSHSGKGKRASGAEKGKRNLGLITRISIEQLYGRYSYEISKDEMFSHVALPSPAERLTILYGDNGSGKTTILKLIFHLLSPSTNRGHRSFIAQVPFRRFVVEFGESGSVSVVRKQKSLLGSYELIFRLGASFALTLDVNASSSGRVEGKGNLDEALSEAFDRIGVVPFFLSDKRIFQSDLIEEPETKTLDDYLNSRRIYDAVHDSSVLVRVGGNRDSGPYSHDKELESAIERAEAWFRGRALADTNAGIFNASNVYFDILEKMATGEEERAEDIHPGYDVVRNRLLALSERAKQYAEFDLGGQFQADRFLRLLEAAGPEQRRILSRALMPHLETSEAQLRALADLYYLLRTFTDALNSLFVDKLIEFRALRKGIRIVTSSGDELPPEALSSGERQLLLLLCNTIVARDSSTLFIIDEPEISLNVKWQRALLTVLLECTAGSNLQFLVATHSIEMITSHQQSLARLERTHG